MQTEEKQTAEEQQEEQEINQLSLIEQDKSTVAILQQDDLATLKEAVEKVKKFKRVYTLKKLTVSDIENKDQKEKLRLALADLRTTRTALTNDKKLKTKPYRDTVAYINDNFDKVIETIEKMEEPLIEHRDKVKADIAAKEKEKEIADQLRLDKRVDKLKEAGAAMQEGYYFIGSEKFEVPPITLSIVDIQGMTDELFDNMYFQVIEKAKIISEKTQEEETRLEKEKKEKEEKEEAERKQFLADQLALKEKNDLLQKQKEEQAEKEKQLNAKIAKIRHSELLEIGLTQKGRTPNHLIYAFDENEPIIFDKSLYEFDDDEWEKLLESTKEKIASVRQLKEDQRLKLEKDQAEEKLWRGRLAQLVDIGWNAQEAFDRANEDVAVFTYTELIELPDEEFEPRRDAYNKLIADRKEATQKEYKDKTDAEIIEMAIPTKPTRSFGGGFSSIQSAPQEDASLAADKTKWATFVSMLSAITFPVMETSDYKEKIGSVRDFISDLK